MIPDSSYAALYAETIDFCRENGAFDPTTMGTTPNVGLMAQKAEEYGSHDKTFEIAAAGKVRDRRLGGRRLLEHEVEAGDIWRACQTKDAPVRDWVRLAVERARATGAPGGLLARRVARARRRRCCGRCTPTCPSTTRDGLQIEILPVREATALHARARGSRGGHDQRHRQRAARLPDRPVPDPRARHEREDALDRAADERRRAVRDRRRRLGAQARPAARAREPSALGLARRVPRAGGLVREARRRDGQPARGDLGPDARRGHRASCSRTASRRRAA